MAAALGVPHVFGGSARPRHPPTGGFVANGFAPIQARPLIPLRIVRNKVILPVRVNESRQLDVILDTGMHYDGLLLYKRELKDSIGVDTFTEARIGGAGEGPAATALVAQSASFSVGEVACDDQMIIVLQRCMT
jgi:hypothetical protein